MIDAQAFPVENFHGGITDNYIEGNRERYRFADNFVVNNLRKLYTRPGSDHNDSSNYLIPSGNQRIGALLTVKDELFVQALRKLYYIDGTYQSLLGPDSNDPFTAGDATNYISWSTWNNHLFITNDAYSNPMKIYQDNLGNWQLRNAGLPALASNPVITPGAGSNSYIYAFVYEYEYTSGTRIFQDFGPTTLVEVTSADAPDSTTISITSIPVLSNGGINNYDTANIKVQIYRTENAGTAFYFVGEVTNGTTTFNDTVPDSTLTNNTPLYTNDGTVKQNPAPLSKYLHVTDNICWYAHIKQGTEELSNRVIQSFQYNPDSVGDTFFVDVDDEITGISSYNFTPIVGCKNSMYRLDGTYADDGSGLVTAQRISDTVGCVSNQSFVRTRKGTFFAGKDGFYWTDGFQVIKISDEFNDRYRVFVQNDPEKIYGTYDEENDRVLWGVQSDSTNGDNDTIYSYELKFGIKEDGCFTTWSNEDSFRPTALLYHKRAILRGDKEGYLFKHDPDIYSDPRIDSTIDASLWVNKTIRYNYESCAYNFGTTFVRKWVSRIVATCSNETKLSLQINSINDKGKKTASLRPINFKNAIIWGEDDVIWGDSTIIWNFDGIIEEQRRFPAKGLRCSYKQVQFTNAYSLIDSSDTTGQVTTNGATKLVTLVDASNKDWPTQAVDYYISFSADNYTREYLVTARTSDTLTVEDVQNNLPTGTYDFKLMGYPKDQVLNLIGYNIHYALIGKTQPTFGTSGGSGS